MTDFMADAKYHDFISSCHKATKRDYLARVNGYSKAEAAKLCKQWGYDYWDGSRDVCYGGYHYDGRWQKVAQQLIDHYQLTSGQKVLDVGCGKGFLAYDLATLCPGLKVTGVDISHYALENAKSHENCEFIWSHAKELPFAEGEFDLVISINTLHNLYCYELAPALQEIVRVSNREAYIVVETYRNEEEKVNLLYWQVTCEMFCTPEEWQWWFASNGYKGDYSFIWFD